MPKPPNWTPKEIQILHTHYTRGGYQQVQAKLPNRTKAAIQAKANKLMIQAGVPHNHVEALEVHAICKHRRASQYLLNQARADGVLHYNPNNWISYTIPLDWADKFNEQFEPEYQLYKQTQNWLNTTQFAKQLNFTRSLIDRAFRRNYIFARQIHAQVQTIRLKYPRNSLKFHPQQAQAFIRKYKQHMTCPNCNHPKTRVICTRPGGTKQQPDNTETKRQRRCPNCKQTFKTIELPTKTLTKRLLNQHQ